MSSITSSIWHTKKEKPTEDKTIFAQHKSFRDSRIDCFLWEKQEFTEAIRKDAIAWCYLDDLLTLEAELIRTRKALDVAVDALNKIYDFYKESEEDPNTVNWHFVAERLANDADDAIKNIEQIKE